jgi:hypothetical protein
MRLLKEFIIFPAVVVLLLSILYFIGFPEWGIEGFWKSALLVLLSFSMLALIKHLFLFIKFYKSFNLQRLLDNKKISSGYLSRKKKLFEIIIHRGNHPHIELLSRDSNVSDKEFILFALLVYAKIIRILSTRNEAQLKETRNLFVATKNAYLQARDKVEYMENLELLFKTLKNACPQDIAQPLFITCFENSIYAGEIQTTALNIDVYLIFLFAFDNIQEINRQLLFQSFVKLTEHDINLGLNAADAILVPNLLVAELRL